MSDRNQTVITRVNQLEKSNRRMKIIGLAALALFGMAATQNHSNVPDLVQSKRFQVVDNKGNVLADLGPFGDKNHPGLGIYDAKGVIRASIGIDAQSDNSVVGAFFSVPGQGGNFVTNDTNGNPTGALPPATP
jgi:hypothetical protein